MNVKVLATGSDANCVWISNGFNSLLVDLGLPKTKAEKVLIDNGIDPTKIDAVFVTHEHKDHCQGLAFADKYKIPVYASEGTLKALDRLDTGHVIRTSGRVFDALRMSYILVQPFRVHHDAAEPLGYTFSGNGFKVSVLMDTGRVTDEMIREMRFSDVYVFECNHDVDMVAEGDYPEITKGRILCDVGHLSNDAAAAALSQLIRGQGERVLLTHMSSNNNMPTLALATIKRALKAKGFTAGQHYQLEVI